MIKKLIVGTFLSILIFFAASFITVIVAIRAHQKLEIGFPFKYYHLFYLRGNNNYYEPQWDWYTNMLFLDCLIFWVVTVGIYLLVKRNKSN